MRFSSLFHCVRAKFRAVTVTGNAVAVLGVVVALTTASISNASIWINEFHYDNVSTDTGEFVEFVVGPGMAINIADVKILLYNGANGNVYDTFASADFVAGMLVNGFQFYSALTPGLQNGAPDGIALTVNDGMADVLQQFLSYEGSFSGVGGPADGVMSTDVGVAQGSSTPEGSSLSLVGTGSEYSDFTWAVTDVDMNTTPSGATIGSPNVGQTLQASTGAVPEVSALVVWTALCGSVLIGWKRRGQLV
jgi:hypothetical protein